MRVGSLFLSLLLISAGPALASDRAGTPHAKANPRKFNERKEYSLLADFQPTPTGTATKDPYSRRLASGNDEADLAHYQNIGRRLGVDLGAMLPFGDFNKVATLSPMLGLHFVWEAIPPFAFTVNYRRASSDNKSTPGSSKLSINQISIGTQASFPTGRFIPFVKLEGAFYFNDFRQNGNAITGDNIMLTTVGVSAGLGFDFVVGREVSIGLDAMYHYAVKQNVSNGGTNFNLGSPFATFAFRVNF